MKRVLVFLNGEYRDKEFYKSEIKRNDYLVCADGGIKFLQKIDRIPDLVVGDLDSLDARAERFIEENKIKTKKFSKNKDFTDGELALDEAVKLAPEKINVYGCFGGRKDHEYANIAILEKYLDRRIQIYLIDEYRTIFLAKEWTVIRAKKGTIVSLLPVTKKVEGIITKGLQYSLRNECLFRASSRGMSNIVTKNPAFVELKKGILKVIVNT